MNRLAILWLLAVGLLGGRLTIAVALAAPFFAYTCCVYLLLSAEKVQGTMIVVGTLAAFVASLAVMAAAAGSVLLHRFLISNSLARLAPVLHDDVHLMQRCVLGYATFMLLVAAALRAYMVAAGRWPPDTLMSFADVGVTAIGVQTAWLLFMAVVILVYMASQASSRYVELLLVNFGAQMWTTTAFTLGVAVACLTVAVGDRLWKRIRASRSPLSTSQLPAKFGLPQTHVTDLGWPDFFYAWRVKSASRSATKSGPQRVVALLGADDRASNFVAAVVVILFYFLLAGSAGGMFPVSFWFMPFAAVVAAMAIPQPVAHMILLPGCATRQTMGNCVLNVWLVTAMRRLVVALVLWLVLNTLFWAIEWRPFDFARVFGEPRTTEVELVWLPLAHGIALAGIIAATCLLMAAAPRLLTRSGWLHASSLVSAALVCAVTYSVLRVTGSVAGVTESRGVDPQFLVRFVLVTGVATPFLALATNLTMRSAWRSANLAQLASAMQQFSRRPDKMRERGW